MAKPTYSLGQVVNQLDSDTSWAGTDITYAMPSSRPYSSGEGIGFEQMTPTMISRAALAFELWDDLVAINLNRTPGAADITFGYSSTTYGDGTYNFSYYSGTDIVESYVWLNSDWESHDQGTDLYYGGYGFLTYIHEIGHALGLDHPGPYNGNGSYASDAVYRQDTHRYTVMSYFYADEDGSRTDHYGSDGRWYYPTTPMVHDIAALQAMYGADMTARVGNTVYGFGANADRSVFDFSVNKNPIVTIWDAGGSDSINVSGWSTNQKVDLRAGHYSNVGHMTNNLGIAYGVTIENARTGNGNDVIYGNAANNTLSAAGGNDTVSGDAGNDRIYGHTGNDKLSGGAGNDRIYAGAGNDRVYGGYGDDLVSGGTGLDIFVLSENRADYSVREVGTYVLVTDLSSGEIDRLYGIEKLIFDDRIILI